MGTCNQKKHRLKKTLTSLPKEKNFIPRLDVNAPEPPKLNMQFEEMPECGNNIYKGYGIKRMKAYKCTLNINELNQLREDFWNTMSLQDSNTWAIIHQACVFDHHKAKIFLENNNFKTQSGCINNLIDSKGRIYHVPNFCINDPFFEREILPVDNKKHDNIIDISIRDVYKMKNYLLFVKEGSTGKELKHIFSKKFLNGRDISSSKVIFGGTVINNEHFLYQHKIKNGYTIHLLLDI